MSSIYYNIFTVHECPSNESTIEFNKESPFGFIIEINGIPDDTPLSTSGSEITPLDVVTIETSTPPGDDFRVMDLEFTITPEGDQPVTVTIRFTTDSGPFELVLTVSQMF